MDIKERIINWMKELMKRGEKVEVLSFYSEVPIRAKTEIQDIEGKFVHWKSEPKLNLAVGETGKLFFEFLDPEFNQKRFLEADVTYYNDEFVETTLPRLSNDPRLSRRSLRVRVPDSSIRVVLIGEEKGEEVKPYDISEDGIGIVVPKGYLNYGDKVKLEVEFPCGKVNAEGVVVSKDSYESGEKVGIYFKRISQREKDLIYRYIVDRQREILKTIRLLTE